MNKLVEITIYSLSTPSPSSGAPPPEMECTLKQLLVTFVGIVLSFPLPLGLLVLSALGW